MTKLFKPAGRYLTHKQMVYYTILFWIALIGSIYVMNYLKVGQ